MEKSFFETHSVDRNGNELFIRVEGVDDKELSHFGGLDLHVKATKEMISDIDATTFPEKNGDYLITKKVIALYLNEIGELIRNSSFDSENLEEYSNFTLVEDFLKSIKNNPELVKIIEKENEVVRIEKERLQQEEADIFKNIIEGLERK